MISPCYRLQLPSNINMYHQTLDDRQWYYVGLLEETIKYCGTWARILYATTLYVYLQFVAPGSTGFDAHA